MPLRKEKLPKYGEEEEKAKVCIKKLCRSDEKDDGIQHSALTACFFWGKKTKKKEKNNGEKTHNPRHSAVVCFFVQNIFGGDDSGNASYIKHRKSKEKPKRKVMQGMRSDASFKKISFPLDKPLVGDSSLARHVAKFNQKLQKKEEEEEKLSLCRSFFFLFGVFLLGVLDTAERCTLGTAKKPKKKRKKSLFSGIHPPHERPCGTKKKKKHKKTLFFWFKYVPRHWKKTETKKEKEKKKNV